MVAVDDSARLHEIAGHVQSILDLLRLPGVGPKRVRLFYAKLGVGSLEELERAVRTGRLRSLGGFGAKSEQRLLEAILTVKSGHARRL